MEQAESRPVKPVEELVREAVGGSREALEEVIRAIQDRVFGLALRMLFHPADAEDAAQEILIKVITHLDSFRHEGPFRAWVYRIAVNHLKTVRKSSYERWELTMDKAQEIMDKAQAKGWFAKPKEAPSQLLELEMRSACTQALLVTMDRDHRIAFILGVVMGVSSREGGYIMGVSPATFRKRLSRSRQRLKDFLVINCDLFDESNPCRCTKILTGYINKGWINPDKPVFMIGEEADEDPRILRDFMKELDDLGKVSALFRAFPEKCAPTDYSTMVKALVDEGRFQVFSELGDK